MSSIPKDATAQVVEKSMSNMDDQQAQLETSPNGLKPLDVAIAILAN
jgi:hypothetical protein